MRVKICGVTSVEDALAAAGAGADALGLNFWALSKRRCDVEVAVEIARRLGERVRLVGVYVDASLDEIERTRAATGVRWAQLHGSEPAELVVRLLPEAYKTVRADASALALARAMPGDELLLDAAVPGVPGGTGVRADWVIASTIARERKLWLAGGLSPENVAQAVTAVRPYGVDVASGVESRPGVKDHERVRAFVEAARSA
ncbi:MAG: phosphoribosylanthranilate isomerase [Sandaracinaceae bacterium]|nr:phosphoribosylanthranilate isomerase [Sandaracinaceae bacterium]